jgi:glycosyltransferase involved in cell wall biosynthesis
MKSKKIRLMQITHDLAVGGLQRVVVNICRTIDRSVFDVSVLCLRALGSLALDVDKLGISVTLIPQRATTDYFSFLKVARVLRSERIDVIHTHNTQPFIDGTLGALLAGVKTIVHTDHARDFPDKRRYMWAERAMSCFAHRVVGVSEDTSRNLVRYEKIHPSKIETIPNGIDGAIFSIQIDKRRKRRELGLGGDGPILGVGARLVEQKGITYLLRAMPEIVKHCPEVTLVVAGEGPLESSLKTEAEHLRLGSSVRFIGVRLDMPELLNLFDVYIQPSVWEGLPMSLLEAMAAGCPIVATNVGGVSAAIETGVNGVLVSPADPDALAREIVHLLSRTELRQKYAEAGLRAFRDQYTAEKMTRSYERLYQGRSSRNTV